MAGFDFIFLAAAFGGGLFGAAAGGIQSFVMCGFLALVGAGVALATGASDFNNAIAWGPYLGPHVAFAGGVAAAAYAARVGKLDSGKNIGTPLMGLNAPDVLLVGGIFGALGYVWAWAITTYLPSIGSFSWMHPVVGSIVINAFLTRLVFGRSGPFGKVAPGANRWVPNDTACWLPWQEKPLQVLLAGLAIGLPTAFAMTKIPAALDFTFALPAAWLLFLVLGQKMPVGHHIGFSSGFAAVALGSFWWGVVIGIFAAFAAELLARTFFNHGDTHIDPPVMGIFASWLVIVVIADLGAKSAPDAVVAAVAVVVAVVGYGILAFLKSTQSTPTPQATTPA